jgi:type II secretory pathway pseudopilin PulG
MIKSASVARALRRPGITLTEILIAILILGVGLASVATLFPLGLLRLRDAARYSRSAYLAQSAEADLSSRSLLSNSSFAQVDYLNVAGGFPTWYNANTNVYPNGLFNPFLQDTPAYGADWAQPNPGAYAGTGGLGTAPSTQQVVNGINQNTGLPNEPILNGPGLPFAYDPLWRYQTVNPGNPQANGPAPNLPGGYYPNDSNAFEARFGSGAGFIRNDLDGNPASAYGLQRISNFNRPFVVNNGNAVPFMLASTSLPPIFVSPEDVVWQDATNPNYFVAGNNAPPVGADPSPVLPDLSITPFQPVSDWRYSWMFTGQLTNSSNLACFDGNVVIFENRPFGINNVTGLNGPTYQVEGETVVEAIFGHSANTNAGGYATGADRTVLLRWSTTFPDPVVKAGDWIADVTYERVQTTVQTRWWQGNNFPFGVVNPSNNGEWDNLPAQRCIWYQVQKVSPTTVDPYLGANFRSMVVYVNQSVQSRTLLSAAGTPVVINAALIAPSVVNVIPTTVFTR